MKDIIQSFKISSLAFGKKPKSKTHLFHISFLREAGTSNFDQLPNFGYLWVWIVNVASVCDQTWVLYTIHRTHKFFNKTNLTFKPGSTRCLNKDQEYFWFKNKLSNTTSLKVVLIKIKSIFGFDLFFYK